MAVDSVIARVPRELYTHFQERAQYTQRTAEEELVDALATIVLDDDTLPADVAAALAPLAAMSDDALWETARDSHL